MLVKMTTNTAKQSANGPRSVLSSSMFGISTNGLERLKVNTEGQFIVTTDGRVKYFDYIQGRS